MDVLAVDVGGTHVKILATGEDVPRKFVSGPTMTPQQMVTEAKKLAAEWKYDVVSIGYPGVVTQGRPISEPHNLACGWVGFHFEKEFGRPVKVINDAAMQALGSYKKGRMLFLGLGTGLGSTMIVDGDVQPMELAHLPYKRGTYEDYVGLRGLEKFGRKKWQRHVFDVVARLPRPWSLTTSCWAEATLKKLKELPPGCRAGNNANAFLGGFRLWGDGVEHLPGELSPSASRFGLAVKAEVCRCKARRSRAAAGEENKKAAKAKGE